MAMKQLHKSHRYTLPLARVFSLEGSYQILDCMLSNYELMQKVQDIAKFTKLDESVVEKSLNKMVEEGLIKKVKEDDAYTTNFKSDRLVGLFSYYRATLDENLKKLEFNKVDSR